MRILLIEDDGAMARNITAILGGEGYDCDTTELGEDGLEIAKMHDYDIIVLDLMPPDIDGHEVLHRLRAARVSTPVLILSGLCTADEKVKGLGSGADDYLTKPFDRGEFFARIEAIIRRAKPHSGSLIRTGRLTLNMDKRSLEVDERPVHLTGKEFGIFEILSLRKGTTLSKEAIFNHLYGGIDEPELKIIDVFICKLRRKISSVTGGENHIHTVWGRGYTLKELVSDNAATRRAA